MRRSQPVIVFNVGGKRYETTTGSIEAHPDTLLCMLLRHKPEDEYELFIDRDAKMFRWILYWYRTGILVDHTTVKVPNEVWLHELEYYGIGNEEQKDAQCLGELSPKRRKMAEAEEELRQKAIRLTQQNEEQDKESAIRRRVVYNNILTYMTDSLPPGDKSATFDFVGCSSEHAPHPYPYNYPDKARFNPVWLSYWFEKEFKSFCAQIGFKVTMMDYHSGTTSRKYHHYPASMTDFRTKHADIRIKIKLL